MTLNELLRWFASQGMPFRWRSERGKPALLLPRAGREVPLGDTEIAVVIPDVHLGWGDDIFRYGSDHHAPRLERFLNMLLQLRAAGHKLEVIQLGDWYDLWRTPPGSFAAKRQAIEAHYPGIVAAARELRIAHCIGNHDAAFFGMPPSDMDVAAARKLGGSQILCFHGHDLVSLKNIVVEARTQADVVGAVNVFATGVPVLGKLAAWVQMVADRTRDPWYSEPRSLPWEPTAHGLPDWDAPWVARDGAIEVGPVIRSLEHDQAGQHFALAIVGHTHRPGISWSPVGPNHAIPLIDAGSWTYGRAELALVCRDGVGLAQF